MPAATPRNPNEWQQIENLFHEALQKQPEERASFLEEVCGSNAEVRREVESLLASAEENDAFLDSPIQDAAASYLGRQSPQPIAGGTLLGSYRVLEMLGRGGMGEVYLAEDVRLKRKVALKLLAQPLNRNRASLLRFEQEAQTLSSLNQTNLLTVFDIGQSGGRLFLITEYIEGATLRTIVNRGPLLPAKAVDIAIQVARALHAAHSAGVVHRDVKPENIMLRSDGCVKVLDFGIAKLGEVTPSSSPGVSTLLNTAAGAPIGTPRYMSPEQARGLAVDARSDLFSLGAVLYEMLAGRPAFEGQTHGDIVADILRSKPVPIAALAGRSSRKLFRIVERLLIKEREERYQQAADVLRDLLEIRSETAISRRRVWRAWWALGIGVAVLIAITIAIVSRHWTGPAAPSNQPRTLAVLPFRNLRPSSETDFLGYSLADEVITKLGYVKALTVRPASAVLRYRDRAADLPRVAADLNADMLLTGTYLKDGEDLQITARLIGGKPLAVLWQNTLDVKYGKLLTVHERVAQLIIDGLELHLDPDEARRMQPAATINPLAYEYFLRGVDLYAASNFGGAIEMLEKSAAIEPNYAPTWAHLGRAYTTHASLQFGGREDYRRAELAYQKAVAANPFSPEPRIYMANLFTDTGRVEEAVPLLRVALRNSPNNAEGHWELGYALRFGGMLHESAAECELARQLDPEVKINSATLNTYLYLGEYKKFLESLPANDSALLVFYHGFALLYLRRPDEAGSDFDRAFELAPDLIQAQIGKSIRYGLSHRPEAGIAQLKQTERKMQERGVSDPEAIYKIAQAYALLGDTRDSLANLRRSVAGGFFPYDYMARDPVLDALHDVPALSEVLVQAHERQDRFRRRFAFDASEKKNAPRP